jgi:hypothetical protein
VPASSGHHLIDDEGSYDAAKQRFNSCTSYLSHNVRHPNVYALNSDDSANTVSNGFSSASNRYQQEKDDNTSDYLQKLLVYWHDTNVASLSTEG